MQEDNAKKLGIRLKEELADRGMAGRAAQLLVKSRNTISNWFANGNIPAAELMRLKEIGVDVNYVLTGDRSDDPFVVKEAPGHYEPSANDDGERVSIVEYDIDVAAGDGCVVLDEQPARVWHIRRDWLKQKGLEGRRLVTVTARGDSMEPNISDGDTLFVDISVTSIDRDGVYVVGLHDHLVVKRVSRRLDKPGLRLTSNNERYPAVDLDAESANQLNIIGRVERVMRMELP